jgi:TPP-dependent pyruvate/acetoin dehydrogenase alpha subunit
MSELERSEVSKEAVGGDWLPLASRRTFLKGVAGAGAAVSLMSRNAWADGEIGFWAKDLPNDKMIEMFNTIVRIRWYERTMVDKMITDPKFRGYNHFYPGQEAVATGVCAALNNKGPFDQLDVVYSTHRPSGHAIAKGVDMKKMAAEYDFR